MSEAGGQSLSLGQRSDTPHSNLAVAGYGPLEQALQGGSRMSSRVGELVQITQPSSGWLFEHHLATCKPLLNTGARNNVIQCMNCAIYEGC